MWMAEISRTPRSRRCWITSRSLQLVRPGAAFWHLMMMMMMMMMSLDVRFDSKLARLVHGASQTIAYREAL